MLALHAASGRPRTATKARMTTDAPMDGPVCMACVNGNGSENREAVTPATARTAITTVVGMGNGSPGASRMRNPPAAKNRNPAMIPTHCQTPVTSALAYNVTARYPQPNIAMVTQSGREPIPKALSTAPRSTSRPCSQFPITDVPIRSGRWCRGAGDCSPARGRRAVVTSGRGC